MHETQHDLRRLQELLDRSYAAAGAHPLRIIAPERRLSARGVAETLTGMLLASGPVYARIDAARMFAFCAELGRTEA